MCYHPISMTRDDDAASMAEALAAFVRFQMEIGVDGFVVPPAEGGTEQRRAEGVGGRKSAARAVPGPGGGESTGGGGGRTRETPTETTVGRTERVGKPTAAEGAQNEVEVVILDDGSPDLLDLADGRRTLEEIREELGDCRRCPLWEGRRTIVFGDGNPKARILFVGEGPGADEDAQGKPFVGRAGKLLDRIIAAMGFERGDVYICNVVKCRPPNNRNPEPEEISSCQPFLFAQIEAVDPEIVICLGSVAANTVLGLKKRQSLASLRQKVYVLGGRKVVVTYHPAALLRNPALKKPLWDDMKLALAQIGLAPPSASGGAGGG